MIKQRLKTRLKEAAERRLNCLILRELPHGFSELYDIRRRKPDVQVVVDVGANVGRAARRFAAVWPTARIYSVEPISHTYEQLVANTRSEDRITCIRCALGSQPGRERMVLQPGTSNNSLLYTVPVVDAEPGTELVDVRTLDDVCGEHGIERIDLLKIDTEGYDLEVLKGAAGLLARRRITFIQVEAGMNPYNDKHVPFQQLRAHLEDAGYVLFGLYDQTLEWSGETRLRYCDAVFVSQDASESQPSPLDINSVRGGLGLHHRGPHH